MYTKDNIGQRIKDRRKELKMTQTELADKINGGVMGDTAPHSQISQWEQGKKIPETDALIRLCNALECDMDYLLGAIETPRKATCDVAEQTGLDVKAVDYLLRLKHRAETEKERGHIGFMAFSTHELKALSYILANNTIGGTDFFLTLYHLIFGHFDKFSMGEKRDNGEDVYISGVNIALIGEDTRETDTIIGVGDIHNIFLLNLQEFLLDLRDRAQGKDRHNQPVTIDWGDD